MTLERNFPRRSPKKNTSTGSKAKLDPVDFTNLMRAQSSLGGQKKGPHSPVQKAKNSSAPVNHKHQKSCTSGCLMDIFANPKRLGVIPGVELKEGILSLNPHKWGCCEASGLRTDSLGKWTYRCDLLFRFNQTKALFELVKSLYPDANLMEIFAPSRFSPVLEQIAKIANGELDQGRVFTREQNKFPFPHLFWATALASVWRFGLKVKLRNFSQQQEVIFGQKKSAHLNGNTEKDDYDLLMVYHVTDLWSSRSFENFDYIVTSAYNACKPLFIDLVLDQDVVAKSEQTPPKEDTMAKGAFGYGVQSTKSGFKTLISQARKKTTTKIYNPGFLYKLRTVSAGVPRGVLDLNPHKT